MMRGRLRQEQSVHAGSILTEAQFLKPFSGVSAGKYEAGILQEGIKPENILQDQVRLGRVAVVAQVAASRSCQGLQAQSCLKSERPAHFKVLGGQTWPQPLVQQQDCLQTNCSEPLFDASRKKNIGATIRIGREIRCLLCVVFLVCKTSLDRD